MRQWLILKQSAGLSVFFRSCWFPHFALPYRLKPKACLFLWLSFPFIPSSSSRRTLELPTKPLMSTSTGNSLSLQPLSLHSAVRSQCFLSWVSPNHSSHGTFSPISNKDLWIIAHSVTAGPCIPQLLWRTEVMVSQGSLFCLCPATVKSFGEGQKVFDWLDKDTVSGLSQFLVV